MRIACLAVCTLNQWAMDFTGNCDRILESIKLAKERGATYRSGPELEVTGYGCGDHFLEGDTLLHSWEVLAYLMGHPACSGIIVDVGMPVMHKNVVYNCRVLFLDGRLLLVRPKTMLCDGGVYRESRWFTAWSKRGALEELVLPEVVRKVAGQRSVPIGEAVLVTSDASIGFEICEELWNPRSSGVGHFLDGVDVTVNGSGGFHEVGNTRAVLGVIQAATSKCGGAYLFSNLRGCDGERVFYHGTSHVSLNGKVVAMGKQFCLEDVEVVTACVDLDDVVSYRQHLSRHRESISQTPSVHVDYSICSSRLPGLEGRVEMPFYAEGEEVALGPACWLWDCLRSGFGGVLLPLDGSVESTSSAVIVYSMCDLICAAVKEGNRSVLEDLRKILGDPNYIPNSPKELCNLILVTCHINSERAFEVESPAVKDLAFEVGSRHFDIRLDIIIDAIFLVLSFLTGGVSISKENDEQSYYFLAMKERLRTVLAYILAEIISCKSKRQSGRLLVLGVGNAETSLLGQFVTHGKCSGDFNLTAAVSRSNLIKFLNYSTNRFGFTSLKVISDSAADRKSKDISREKESKDLSPGSFRPSQNQTDSKSELHDRFDMRTRYFEDNSDLSEEQYKELELFGSLRRDCNGPYSTFCKLVSRRSVKESLEDISSKVKRLFSVYSLNHCNVLTIAPSYHANCYDATNIYHDQRPILYKGDWSWQFETIDKEIKSHSCRSTND